MEHTRCIFFSLWCRALVSIPGCLWAHDQLSLASQVLGVKIYVIPDCRYSWLAILSGYSFLRTERRSETGAWGSVRPVHVCVSERMYICVCVHVYICVCLFLSVFVYVCVYIYMHEWLCFYVFVYMLYINGVCVAIVYEFVCVFVFIYVGDSITVWMLLKHLMLFFALCL